MEVGPLWYGGDILAWSWAICYSAWQECPLYQDDNAPIHTAKIVQEWFAEHEGEVGHLDWLPQSPDLNIIEHLWGYLESKLRARFPPPSTISALETALYEE
ncbi:transposable element Tcb2 transposase [Trichonephila clavipes]|nr:transposable element Tcb2 transposase [Trichonephila clavipes]